jgi:cytochrome c biogenesis protein CcdA|tara:strand:- start:42 stop:218 length:177 start_codon:yes stop_codon:yes gene_type:complete
MIDTITNLIEQNGIIAIVASIVLGALSSLSPCSLAAIPFISGMAANSYPDLNEEERQR